MSVGYSLVNVTKREQIAFLHVAASTKRELAGNPVSASLIAWYLLENIGDEIAFVSDTHGEWPFSLGARDELAEFDEVTDRVVQALIEADILRDDGIAWADEDEPDLVFERALANVWVDE